MIDQLLLGELSTETEWQEALEEYDNDWYIGLEKEPEWTAAVLEGRPSLFSLSQNNTQVISQTQTWKKFARIKIQKLTLCSSLLLNTSLK